MAAGFVYRLFLRVFAKSAVKDAYAGILNREADAAGLAAYTARVRRAGLAQPMLESMAQSDEAWRLVLKSHAATLLAQCIATLRDGDATPEELADWTRSLEAGDLQGVLRSIHGEDSAWERLLRHKPGELVRAAYQGLLGRQPDAHEVDNYAQYVSRTGDAGAFFAEIGQSEEHRRLIGASVDATALSHQAIITASFRALLGRDPDADALASYGALLAETGDLTRFIAEVGQSPEHRKRLLLRRG